MLQLKACATSLVTINFFIQLSISLTAQGTSPTTPTALSGGSGKTSLPGLLHVIWWLILCGLHSHIRILQPCLSSPFLPTAQHRTENTECCVPGLCKPRTECPDHSTLYQGSGSYLKMFLSERQSTPASLLLFGIFPLSRQYCSWMLKPTLEAKANAGGLKPTLEGYPSVKIIFCKWGLYASLHWNIILFAYTTDSTGLSACIHTKRYRSWFKKR